MAGTRLGFVAAGIAAGWAGARRLRRRQDSSLAGKAAVVTGGSRGLGLLIARELADRGCKVGICARDARELERARADLSRRTLAFAMPCDVSDPGQVDAFIERCAAELGGIDLLVNNASIIQVGPFASMTRQDFEQAMAVNFWGAVNAIFAALPSLRRSRGRIVNITSIGGKVAVPHLLPYDCAKFATVGLSEGLRAELLPEGITVTTIIPGLMRTGSPVNALFKGQKELEFSLFSLGDALPLSSMDARRAARRIVDAAARGEATVTLSWQARLLRLLHALFPGWTAGALAAAASLLPGPGKDGARQARGMELSTGLVPSPLTWLMNRAARDLNQYGGLHQPSPTHAQQVGLDGEVR